MWRVRRLHVQLYLAIVATLLVLGLVSALIWHFVGFSRGEMWGVETAAQLAENLLPAASASSAEQQSAIQDLHTQLRIDLALYDDDGELLGSAGPVPLLKPRHLMRPGWTFSRGGPVWVLILDDGRRLAVRPRHLAHASRLHLFVVPAAILVAFALGAYPVARRITRRLERLQTGVEQLGAGDLATRVTVEGHDEVAALARSFNASAERIEELVNSQKLLLANCSHELRTPLARIRLGLERLATSPDQRVHDELARSIAELDTLIDEILLAGRLDVSRALEHSEEVDLLALAAEEAAQFDRSVEGRATTVQGDPRLLRRMARNLLDNAQRHAGGATRIVVDHSDADRAELIVEDRGVGIAPDEHEKIFEPFHRSRTVSSVKGFGLGLALVRQIARAHGGDVRYSLVAEGGSRFTVTLPLHGQVT